MDNLIEAYNISYNYGKLEVLSQVNLKLPKNSFFLLFGPDDAGKTTLLNILMGLDGSYSGDIKIFGKKNSNFDDDLCNMVRFIPDDIIWEKIDVKDYFNFISSESDNYDADMQNILCTKYSINIDDNLMNTTYRNNKMVQIIAAMCAKPELLILDEPFNFLDVKTYQAVLGDLKERSQNGINIILALEKYSQGMGYGNSFAYLKEGKILRQGMIPSPDYRWKVVKLFGNINLEFEKQSIKKLFERSEFKYYLYNGLMNQLPHILQMSDCDDCSIEEMTLEEEIDFDFSRWE